MTGQVLRRLAKALRNWADDRTKNRTNLSIDADALRLTKWNAGLPILAVMALLIGILHNCLPDHFWQALACIPLVFVTATGAFSLVGSLWSHRRPETIEENNFPTLNKPAQHTFALLVPARKEAAVIEATLLRLAQMSHPGYYIFAIICDDDLETLEAVRSACRTSELIKLIIYPIALANGKPSKPKQLNYARAQILTQHSPESGNRVDVFGIMDAESIAHPHLLDGVEAAFQAHPDAHAVQGGVQLMDPQPSGKGRLRRSQSYLIRWFSWHNLTEYFRWFQSQMSMHSAFGFVPYGGNTIFVKDEVLALAGGWPDTLTEDCMLGTWASSVYEFKTVTYYEPELATQEETPSTLGALFHQRVRWMQGFLETLIAGHWRAIRSPLRRLGAVWILSSAFMQAMSGLLVLVSILSMLYLRSPVILVLAMYLPLFMMVGLLAIQLNHLREFGQKFGRKIAWYTYVLVVMTYVPYQFVLSAAAVYATCRHMLKVTSWVKTEHTGEHVVSSSATSTA